MHILWVLVDDSPYKALQNPSHTASAKRTNDQEHMNQQVTDMLPFLSSAHGRPTRIATAAAPCCIFTHGYPAIFYTALILARALALEDRCNAGSFGNLHKSDRQRRRPSHVHSSGEIWIDNRMLSPILAWAPTCFQVFSVAARDFSAAARIFSRVPRTGIGFFAIPRIFCDSSSADCHVANLLLSHNKLQYLPDELYMRN
ncbi:hypothetical protein O6H91_Y340300 [Diphasiastrum complanatum]|nr:hypothetical protein O6H91_Y340300 [Diphasiastrum complanatum]